MVWNEGYFYIGAGWWFIVCAYPLDATRVDAGWLVLPAGDAVDRPILFNIRSLLGWSRKPEQLKDDKSKRAASADIRGRVTAAVPTCSERRADERRRLAAWRLREDRGRRSSSPVSASVESVCSQPPGSFTSLMLQVSLSPYTQNCFHSLTSSLLVFSISEQI